MHELLGFIAEHPWLTLFILWAIFPLVQIHIHRGKDDE